MEHGLPWQSGEHCIPAKILVRFPLVARLLQEIRWPSQETKHLARIRRPVFISQARGPGGAGCQTRLQENISASISFMYLFE